MKLYKFQAILDRCGARGGQLREVVSLLFHWYRFGYVTSGDLSVNKMRDPKTSVVEVCKLAVEMKAHLLDDIRSFSLPADEAEKIKGIGSTPEKFRAVKPWPSWSLVQNGKESDKPEVNPLRRADGEMDLHFMAKWCDRSKAVIDKLNHFVYSDGAMATLKSASRQRKNLDDFLEYPSVVSELEEISAAPNVLQTEDGEATQADEGEAAKARKPMGKGDKASRSRKRRRHLLPLKQHRWSARRFWMGWTRRTASIMRRSLRDIGDNTASFWLWKAKANKLWSLTSNPLPCSLRRTLGPPCCITTWHNPVRAARDRTCGFQILPSANTIV